MTFAMSSTAFDSQENALLGRLGGGGSYLFRHGYTFALYDLANKNPITTSLYFYSRNSNGTRSIELKICKDGRSQIKTSARICKHACIAA